VNVHNDPESRAQAEEDESFLLAGVLGIIEKDRRVVRERCLRLVEADAVLAGCGGITPAFCSGRLKERRA
jgi:hypothetical protein